MCDFEFVRNYPPTINTPAEAQFARKVMASIVGEDKALEQEPSMGAEDFAYMLQAKPGRLSVHCQRRWQPPRNGPRRRALHAAQPQLRLQ